MFSMRATDGPTGQVPGARPSPNNMPSSWYDVQDLQQVLWAKAEGMERHTRLELLKRTSKTSIWSEEVKPDHRVSSRGRSGMGSNIAGQRRHNDSVD